jgi:hypothetical protein
VNSPLKRLWRAMPTNPSPDSWSMAMRRCEQWYNVSFSLTHRSSPAARATAVRDISHDTMEGTYANSRFTRVAAT